MSWIYTLFNIALIAICVCGNLILYQINARIYPNDSNEALALVSDIKAAIYNEQAQKFKNKRDGYFFNQYNAKIEADIIEMEPDIGMIRVAFNDQTLWIEEHKFHYYWTTEQLSERVRDLSTVFELIKEWKVR